MFFTTSQGETQKISETEHEYNFYVGTFDKIDKEGDDKTSLFDCNNTIFGQGECNHSQDIGVKCRVNRSLLK